MTAPGPTIDYGAFHADPTVIHAKRISIPVDAVTGWTSKLTRFTRKLNFSTTEKRTTVLFHVTGPGTLFIKLEPSYVTNTGLIKQKGHADMEQLGARLQEYGAKVIAPVLVPRLCQRVVAGEELNFGVLTVGQRGITKSGTALAWADFHDTAVEDGSVFVRQRTERGGKTYRSPFATVDLAVLNAILLPAILQTLRSFYTR
jgi:hypothetical protein